MNGLTCARRLRTALTLAELVLALVITTIIGLAVAGVSASVSKVNQHAEAYYDCLQTGRVISTRLENILRSSLLVTTTSDGSFMAWTNDDFDPGQINESELTRIYLDQPTGQLLEVTTVYPDSLTQSQIDALDGRVTLATATSASYADNLASSSAYEVTSVLANNVQSFDVYPDTAAPMTHLIQFRLVISAGGETATQYGAGMLRAPSTDKVTKTDSGYVLN